jgi:hypothetical protein
VYARVRNFPESKIVPFCHALFIGFSSEMWSCYFCFKNKALLVMLSMCQFERVLELLGSQKLHAQAGLLLQACQEFEIFSPAARSKDILLNSHRRYKFPVTCHPITSMSYPLLCF